MTENDLKDLASHLHGEGFFGFSKKIKDSGYDLEGLKTKITQDFELRGPTNPSTHGYIVKQTILASLTSPFIKLPIILSKTKYVSRAIITWRLRAGI